MCIHKANLLTVKLKTKLTEKRIGETIPLATQVPDEPPPVDIRSKTEWRAKNAHKYVTDADVQQDEVDGCPETTKLCEYQQNEKIVKESEKQDNSEENCYYGVAGPTQTMWEKRILSAIIIALVYTETLQNAQI